MIKKLESDNPKEPQDYLKLKVYQLIALLKTIKKAFKTILAKKVAYFVKNHSFLLKTHIRGKKYTLIEHTVYFLIKKILAA